MNTEFHTPFEWFMQMYIYKTWMEGTYDTPNKNPHYFVTKNMNQIGWGFRRNADN